LDKIKINFILFLVYITIILYPKGYILTKQEFKLLLAKAELRKKDLSLKLGIAQSTVNNWGSSKDIPYWIESWLNNYIMAKKFQEVKRKICDKTEIITNELSIG
jgi:DNA-binding XRE family transcriptional regulator